MHARYFLQVGNGFLIRKSAYGREAVFDIFCDVEKVVCIFLNVAVYLYTSTRIIDETFDVVN